MQIINHQTEKKSKISEGLSKNILCFSHLRWDFVFQRPQHLLTRFSKSFRIFFIEEPIADATGAAYYAYINKGKNITLIVPHIPAGLSYLQERSTNKALFDAFMQPNDPSDFIFWYYTPMALTFSRQYVPKLTVFDCMDELSAFKFAPEELKHLESELLQKADIVFTGGQSLYQAKKHQHNNIHLFASSIDQSHFEKAREIDTSPTDQPTGNVTLGFFGVIDERFDYELIRGIANSRPDWQIVLIGPVVKIDPHLLPKNANIHYLGAKTYQQLPEYIASWHVALIPFQLNESTRYISPTKTPEYLAAGLPVVSTPIADVISPYGDEKIVQIADGADEFVLAIERVLAQPANNAAWLNKVDAFLASNSWDKTCEDMLELMSETDARNQSLLTAKVQANI